MQDGRNDQARLGRTVREPQTGYLSLFERSTSSAENPFGSGRQEAAGTKPLGTQSQPIASLALCQLGIGPEPGK